MDITLSSTPTKYDEFLLKWDQDMKKYNKDTRTKILTYYKVCPHCGEQCYKEEYAYPKETDYEIYSR